MIIFGVACKPKLAMKKKMILKKIENRSAHAGVIGLGYVGLPLMVAIAKAGFRVMGIDICPQRITQLKQGISHVPDVANPVEARRCRQGG